MDSHTDFLSAITQHPRDMDARLIYADFLEEQGDPRGEFIRIQCELASPSDDLDRRDVLDRRQEQLRSRHERKWVQILREKVTSWTFRCGFVESVEVSAEQFLKHADAIFAATPIRSLTVTSASNLLDRIVAHPRVAELEGLHLERSELSVTDTQCIAQVSFRRLNSLRLSSCRLVDATFLPLLDLNVPSLRDADFSANRLRNHSFTALSVSRAFHGITELNVMANEIRQTGAQQFAGSPGFPDLELLDIRGNPIGRSGARALFERFGQALRF
ncbi:MAG: TIGR02996 domain-containing protein [Planctomycetaceae bacterium]|nr:TIGR02996 domain-containing protein [Planctomycetaceae bacterium]